MKTPDKVFGPLFIAIQTSEIFPDSKTFADCTPNKKPELILSAYHDEKDKPGFEFSNFVKAHFTLPQVQTTDFKSDLSRSATEHIEVLWPYLERSADKAVPGSSLIPLPHPYIVPGGRFGEIYYWDSFFTMLGLKVSNKLDIIENMVDNFTFLINEFGHIPNGNRSYFLSRSQPPFYAEMVNLLIDIKGDHTYKKYLQSLEKEYDFWMKSERAVDFGGSKLNRYWDSNTAPRQESYSEDVELAETTDNPEQLYLDLRAACESGWDFSSRWLVNPKNLDSIRTSKIFPIDLNCLLYNLEMTIANAYLAEGVLDKEIEFVTKANARKELINQYLWDEKKQIYQDLLIENHAFTDVPSAAMTFPLYFNIATKHQAERTKHYLMSYLSKDGGVVCTNHRSGQQWDAPNGWAPLQWMAVIGLLNYGYETEAQEIAQNWIVLNEKVYYNTGKFMEKYNVMDMNLEAGGGEYPVQDGFGWSNGVYLALKAFVNQ